MSEKAMRRPTLQENRLLVMARAFARQKVDEHALYLATLDDESYRNYKIESFLAQMLVEFSELWSKDMMRIVETQDNLVQEIMANRLPPPMIWIKPEEPK